MIKICDLSKIYPSRNGDVVALKHIDLTIEDGAIYGVIGLSGAGKSTLIRCINLLERPTSGKVILDGEDITVVKKKRLLKVKGVELTPLPRALFGAFCLRRRRFTSGKPSSSSAQIPRKLLRGSAKQFWASGFSFGQENEGGEY